MQKGDSKEKKITMTEIARAINIIACNIHVEILTEKNY